MADCGAESRDTTVRFDIATLLRDRSVVMDDDIRRRMAESRAELVRLREYAVTLEARLKDLEAQDKLGNFEIQDLMSTYNQSETLASSILKKKDCVANSIISKI